MSWEKKFLRVSAFFVLCLLAALTACGNGSSSDGGKFSDDASDDDIAPPDDDLSDDDDADDSDDDSGGPTTTTPTTTTTTQTGGTTTTTGTGTTTTSVPGSPYVHINMPANGADIDGYAVDIQADLEDADTVVVTVDSVDVTSYVSVTGTQVTGTLYLDGGPHTLTVSAENTHGPSSDSVSFNVDMGKIVISEPAPGAIYNIRDIPVNAQFFNVNSSTLHVILDKINDGYPPTDVTGELYVSGDTNGNVTGTLTYQTPGDYLLKVTGTNPNNVDPDHNPDGTVEAESYYTIELVAAHINVWVDDNTIQTGDSVHVSYEVIDEEGNDRTGETAMDWNVIPGTGVQLDIPNQTVTFNNPGMYKIVLATILEGTPLEGQVYVWVSVQPPASVEITLSDYDVQAGDSVSAYATVYDENHVPIYGNVVWSAWPGYGVTITQGNPGSINFTHAGSVTVRGTVEGASLFDEKTVSVAPDDPFRIELILPDPVVNAGDFTHPEVFLEDQYGNQITQVGANLSVYPMTGVQMNTPAAGDITFNQPGIFNVTATAQAPWSGLHNTKPLQVIDVSAPDIEIWTPVRGTWTTDNTSQLTGIVHGCDYINDRIYYSDSPSTPRTLAAPPHECEFSHAFSLETGLNVLELRVTESGGASAKASVAVMRGGKNPTGQMITDGLFFRANELGFTQLSAAMLPTIQDYVEQVPQMLFAMNPLFNESVEVWGVTIASARADLTSVSIGEPGFTLDVLPDLGVKLIAWIDDIDLGFRVRGSVLGIGYSISGHVSFDRVKMIADAFIYVDQYDQFTVNLANISMQITGFHFDINNFPDELEGLFEDTIRDIIEGIVNDVLADAIPPLLEELLSQLPEDFTFQFNGAQFSVKYDFNRFWWDSDGVIIKMDVGISSPNVNPTVPDYGGSLKTPGPAPADSEIGMYIPHSSIPYGFGIVLADDVINQALSVFNRAGLLSQDFNGMFDTSNLLIRLVFPGLHETYPGTINVKIRPTLPPVVVVAPAGMTDGFIPVEFQIGDLLVNMFVNSGGTERLFLQMAVSLMLPADLAITYPDNAIEVTFGDPSMSVYVFAEPLMDWDNALFEDIAPLLADLITPLLSGLLQGIELPNFDVNGYGLYLLDEQVMGGASDYIGIFTNLEPVP